MSAAFFLGRAEIARNSPTSRPQKTALGHDLTTVRPGGVAVSLISSCNSFSTGLSFAVVNQFQLESRPSTSIERQSVDPAPLFPVPRARCACRSYIPIHHSRSRHSLFRRLLPPHGGARQPGS